MRKSISLRSAVMALFMIGMGILMVAGLLFYLIRIETEGIVIGQNGYANMKFEQQGAGMEAPREVRIILTCSLLSGIFGYLQLLAGIATFIIIPLTLITTSGNVFHKICFGLIITTAVFSITYMVLGLILRAQYLSVLETCDTQSYIPLILCAVLFTGYMICGAVVPRTIRITLIREDASDVTNKPVTSYDSSIELIREYHAMLTENLISSEDYETLKQGLLNQTRL